MHRSYLFHFIIFIHYYNTERLAARFLEDCGLLARWDPKFVIRDDALLIGDFILFYDFKIGDFINSFQVSKVR